MVSSIGYKYIYLYINLKIEWGKIIYKHEWVKITLYTVYWSIYNCSIIYVKLLRNASMFLSYRPTG